MSLRSVVRGVINIFDVSCNRSEFSEFGQQYSGVFTAGDFSVLLTVIAVPCRPGYWLIFGRHFIADFGAGLSELWTRGTSGACGGARIRFALVDRCDESVFAVDSDVYHLASWTNMNLWSKVDIALFGYSRARPRRERAASVCCVLWGEYEERRTCIGPTLRNVASDRTYREPPRRMG